MAKPIEVTRENYWGEFKNLPETRLDIRLNGLLVEIIGNYFYNLDHTLFPHTPPMLPEWITIEALNKQVGTLILDGTPMKIVDAYPDAPKKELIRLTLSPL